MTNTYTNNTRDLMIATPALQQLLARADNHSRNHHVEEFEH